MSGTAGGRNAGGASIIAAAAAAGSSENRFAAPQERRNRWGGCFAGLSCFGSQKRAKRIVPSRVVDGNVASNGGNGPQPSGMTNQTTTLNLSLLAPPSSPASFTNSALPSTAQSPSCLFAMSGNSPRGLSSTMFAIGPYAHETQLVSPPVFSTYTTEPSTAPLTPPPELAHLTTPSSPDVPYAHYLSSSLDFRNGGKENGIPYVKTGYVTSSDLQATYPLYPGSPASSLISPMSVTPRTGMSSPFPEREGPAQWVGVVSAPDSRTRSPKQSDLNDSMTKCFLLPSNSSFFYPAKSAQFYLDQAHLSNPSCGARLSISKETDILLNCGSQLKQTWKQDVEELEAYRASFGFSADEIIATPSYVEITDAVDISFAVPALTSNGKQFGDQYPDDIVSDRMGKETVWPQSLNSMAGSKQDTNLMLSRSPDRIDGCAGHRHPFFSRTPAFFNVERHSPLADENLSTKTRDTRGSRSFRMGLSSSDAEIDYRRSRSLKGSSSLL